MLGAKLIGISHDTWGIVRFNLNGAPSSSPTTPTGQILAGWDSITCDSFSCHHMAQPDIRLVIKNALIRTLRLAALRLGLAVIVEVIIQERCLIAFLGEVLRYLLVLTNGNRERPTCGIVTCRCSRCQRNIVLVLWAVLERLFGSDFVLSLLGALAVACYLGVVEEVVRSL